MISALPYPLPQPVVPPAGPAVVPPQVGPGAIGAPPPGASRVTASSAFNPSIFRDRNGYGGANPTATAASLENASAYGGAGAAQRGWLTDAQGVPVGIAPAPGAGVAGPVMLGQAGQVGLPGQVGGQFRTQSFDQILRSLNTPQAQDPQLTSLIAELRAQMGGNDSATINQALAAQRAAAYGELNNQALLEAAARGMTLGGGDYGKLYSELQAPIERQLMAGAADAQLQASQRRGQQGIQLAQLLSNMQSDAAQRESQRQSTALNLYSTQQDMAARQQEMALRQAMAAQDIARGNISLQAAQRALNAPGSVSSTQGMSTPGAGDADRMAAIRQSLAIQEQARKANEAWYASNQPPAGIFTGDMSGPGVRAGGLNGSAPNPSPFHTYLNQNSVADRTRADNGIYMNSMEAERIAQRRSLGLPTPQVAGRTISGPDGAGSTLAASRNIPGFQAMYPTTTNARGLM